MHFPIFSNMETDITLPGLRPTLLYFVLTLARPLCIEERADWLAAQ